MAQPYSHQLDGCSVPARATRGFMSIPTVVTMRRVLTMPSSKINTARHRPKGARKYPPKMLRVPCARSSQCMEKHIRNAGSHLAKKRWSQEYARYDLSHYLRLV